MKKKLFPNMKRLTTLFGVSILSVTLIFLALRLTVFSDISRPDEDDPSNPASQIGTSQSGAFEYKINQIIYFQTGDSAGDLLIENPSTNVSDMKVEISINDTGRSVFVSGTISPGGVLKTGKLLGAKLSNGVYECTAVISAYETGTKNKLESESIPVTIYIGQKPE